MVALLPPLGCNPVSTAPHGVAFVAFLFFYLTCDLLKFKIPTLTIVGENPLVIYILQYALMAISGSYFFSEEFGKIKPADVTFGSYAWAIFGSCVFYWSCWTVANRLHNQGYIIKLSPRSNASNVARSKNFPLILRPAALTLNV